jgi:hypothetical protein
LYDFELKRFDFEKSFKKKKGKKTLPSIQLGRPTGPSNPPTAARLPTLSFLFP